MRQYTGLKWCNNGANNTLDFCTKSRWSTNSQDLDRLDYSIEDELSEQWDGFTERVDTYKSIEENKASKRFDFKACVTGFPESSIKCIECYIIEEIVFFGINIPFFVELEIHSLLAHEGVFWWLCNERQMYWGLLQFIFRRSLSFTSHTNGSCIAPII
jgi:hypothetical protein